MKNIALAILAVGFIFLSRWNAGDGMTNGKGLLLEAVALLAAAHVFIV